MNWILGILALGVVTMIYQSRKLSLNELIHLLSMNDKGRLSFANNRKFHVQTGGSNIPSLNFLKRHDWIGGDWLYFPHDNQAIEKYNQSRSFFWLFYKGITVQELEAIRHPSGLLKYTEFDFVSYGYKPWGSGGLEKKAISIGFVKVEGSNFSDEALMNLAIKKSEFGEHYFSVHGENCEFYKSQNYGLVHGKHKDGTQVYTIFNL